MPRINVLLIGSGGREHSLAWAMSASPLLDRLYCAPGNPGIAEVATLVNLDAADHAAIIAFCHIQAIGLLVVGPEAPLVAGLADDLALAGIKVFGPSRAAARLEGSKSFTKDICARYGIPTAEWRSFRDHRSALEHVRSRGVPIVIKADGLAAGKGVTVATSLLEAESALAGIFSGEFGDAACVVEDYLEGEEASFFALCDGTRAVPFAAAQDHKRVGEGDTGANTGGMGAYSPAPVVTGAVSAEVMRGIVEPTLLALREQGTPFVGVLFAGLMITPGGPKLIEYNVRFGDPECQVLMMRLKDDLLTLMLAAVDGALNAVSIRWREEAALAVVVAARGYPGQVVKGSPIVGLDGARSMPGVQIFQAGTALKAGGLVSAGGRVLNVAAIGKTIAEARARAYAAVDAIDFPDGFCRRDIGWRALARHG